MGSVALDLLSDSGFATSGVGPATFVGRNRSITLSLTLSEIVAAGSVTVAIETAASAQASTWRTAMTASPLSALGSLALTPVGCADFIRARYTLSGGAALSFSLSGTAALLLLASGPITVSGVSTAVDVGQYRAARLALDVTAVSGTLPTLALTIETADSATSTTWRTVATFASVTAPSSPTLTAADFGRWVRVRYVVSGTSPVFTIAVAGESVLVLAGPAERTRLGIRGGAIPDVLPTDAVEAMIAASAIVLGYLGRYELPLRTWGDDLRRACIVIADWLLLSNRGGDPGKQPGSELYRIAYEDMVGRPGQGGWLDKVSARNGVCPAGLVDSTQPDTAGALHRVAVSSEPLRGWGSRTFRIS